jgi:uncharacterized protein
MLTFYRKEDSAMFTPHGKFGWYELMTTDTAAAGEFYRDVVGWTSQEMNGASGDYTVFSAEGAGVAGMLTIPEDAKVMGTPPSWIGYITVDDVDAHIPKITEAGGKLLRPATDIPGMLRFAVVADPGGAAFIVFTPNPAMTPPANRPVPPAPGTISWHELYAADGAAAFDFYSSLFGWTKGETMDMGPMGIYQIFNMDGAQAGGMMTKPPNIPVAFWTYYFQVDDINAAIERLKAGGGIVMMGPHQVPGGSWIVQGTDPQGANFALVSAKG